MGSIAAELICHPDTPACSVGSVTVHVERSAADRLWLRYHLDVPPDRVSLPDLAGPGRADGLWKTTCFEVFVRLPDAACYAEFNFAPSSQWAAYRFDNYRAGMTELALGEAPKLGLDASETHVALEADLVLPGAFGGAKFATALAAVIEETGGTKSYWALRHPPGPPDFHHPDCFALELPAPGQA